MKQSRHDWEVEFRTRDANKHQNEKARINLNFLLHFSIQEYQVKSKIDIKYLNSQFGTSQLRLNVLVIKLIEGHHYPPKYFRRSFVQLSRNHENPSSRSELIHSESLIILGTLSTNGARSFFPGRGSDRSTSLTGWGCKNCATDAARERGRALNGETFQRNSEKPGFPSEGWAARV